MRVVGTVVDNGEIEESHGKGRDDVSVQLYSNGCNGLPIETLGLAVPLWN